MDFPSSKCFCSTAGQSRPQHAWLQRAAAHPTAAPTWRGEGRKPLEGFTVTNSLSQECMFGRIIPSIFQTFKIINEQRRQFIRCPKDKFGLFRGED